MQEASILILGDGKLSYALQHVLGKHYDIHICTREHFNALTLAGVSEIVEKYHPDYVYNTVVYGGIDACGKEPVAAYRVNTLFPWYLAKLSARNAFTLVHFSSESVFPDVPLTERNQESSTPLPANIYGATKFNADSLIMHTAHEYYIFRLPLLLGPCTKKNQFFEKLLYIGQQKGFLRISQDVYSTPAYSMDVAERLFEVLLRPLDFGVYHLANPEVYSLYEIISYAITILDIDVKLEPAFAADFPACDIKNLRSLISSEKIKALRSSKKAIERYCSEYATNLILSK